MHQIFRTTTAKVAAVTAIVLTATAFGAAAQASESGPVAAVADPSWSDLPRVKEDARIAATQARLLRGNLRELDTELTTARESAQAATAALVDAQYALPDKGIVAAVADDPAAVPTGTGLIARAITESAAASAPLVVVEPAEAETAAAGEVEALLVEAPPATPEQLYAVALDKKKSADEVLADQEVEAAETKAQLAFLATADADARELQNRAIETAERKVKADAAQRLAAEKERKVAEEAARVAAEEAARVAAEEAARQAYLNRWVSPAGGGIADTYGPRAVICAGGGCSSPFHGGTDVATGCGAPVYAAHAGTVTSASPSGSLGNYVTIDHGTGVSTGYAHLTSFNVGAGQGVAAGDVVGWSGTTGASTGCHLHFEVYVGGAKVDPQPFLAGVGAGIG